MSVTSTLHLNFPGQARKALEFHHSVFGGDIVLAPTAVWNPVRTCPQAVWSA